MIIAIPSVTKYISDSRKSSYVNTTGIQNASLTGIINSGSVVYSESDYWTGSQYDYSKVLIVNSVGSAIADYYDKKGVRPVIII